MECIHFYVKVPKTAKKGFWSSDLLRKSHSFRGQALHKGPNFFSPYGFYGLMGIKNAVFNVDFKNINLP
jgi:hypothetical protein